MSSKKLKPKSADNKAFLYKCDKCGLQFYSSLVGEHKSVCGTIVNHTFFRENRIFARKVDFTGLPEDLKEFPDKVGGPHFKLLYAT